MSIRKIAAGLHLGAEQIPEVERYLVQLVDAVLQILLERFEVPGVLARYDLDETKPMLSKSAPIGGPEIVRFLNEIRRKHLYARESCACLHWPSCGEPSFVLAESHDQQHFLSATYGLPGDG